MRFVAAINFSHRDIRGVAHFLCDNLEFSLIGQDNSSITVNNGVLSLRFCKNDENSSPISLDMETTDLTQDGESLKLLGFVPINDLNQVEDFRIEQKFTGPFGIIINLHKVLDEDDLGILPDLDITLDWDPLAVKLAKDLLQHVAIHFRYSARKKMVKQAEALAMVEGNLEVSIEDMVTAFLYTTPYFKQNDLQRLLIDNGISREFIEIQIQKM